MSVHVCPQKGFFFSITSLEIISGLTKGQSKVTSIKIFPPQYWNVLLIIFTSHQLKTHLSERSSPALPEPSLHRRNLQTDHRSKFNFGHSTCLRKEIRFRSYFASWMLIIWCHIYSYHFATPKILIFSPDNAWKVEKFDKNREKNSYLENFRFSRNSLTFLFCYHTPVTYCPYAPFTTHRVLFSITPNP